MVSSSSLVAAAKALIPTGPPLKLSIITSKIFLSVASNPHSSISNNSKVFLAVSASISSFPSMVAKSRLRFNKRLATRGVARLALAKISVASSEILIFKSLALFFKIFLISLTS